MNADKSARNTVENTGKNCPGCFKKGSGPFVEIFIEREPSGLLSNIYIWGDDDFDMPSSKCGIVEFTVSKDEQSIVEIVCPRCGERIKVNIPIIKEQTKKVIRDNVSNETGKEKDA